jgi:hypothetical protein
MNTATAKSTEVALNTWYQIHTNGGITTFARIYEGQDADGFGCFWFEKMSVDTTVPQGGAEIFGQQDFTSDLTAKERLIAAMGSSL